MDYDNPRPHIIIIAGPNGTGKSTTAPSLLQGTLGVKERVNADVLVQGFVKTGADASFYRQ